MMSVLVPSLTNNHHHHSPFFASMSNTQGTRRLNGTKSSTKSNPPTTPPPKSNDNDQDSDQVPYGVVNSMKQRFLNKVNQSYVFNPTANVIGRPPLSKNSSRLSSNENLIQHKPLPSPLKRTTRLSRSQDNLSNSPSIPIPPSTQHIPTEQYTSYLQPKHELIIVDSTTKRNHVPDHENDRFTDDDNEDGKLRTGPKSSSHRQSYTELHRDEAPKPGTVTTVKNMFERQIRLSRYDADKIFTTGTPVGSRVSSQHRDVSSPNRSRSMSPNDMALRQRRAIVPPTNVASTPATLSLPVTTYPDLVISHTPPTETTKTCNESILINQHSDGLPANSSAIMKEKKLFVPLRNPQTHETQLPLTVIVDDHYSKVTHTQRQNLLLPSKSSTHVDCEPLDFKSRLALFNRTNTQASQENNSSTTNRRSLILSTTSSVNVAATPATSTSTQPTTPTVTTAPVAPVTLPSVLTPATISTPTATNLTNSMMKINHQNSVRSNSIEERKDNQSESFNDSPLSISVARSVINPAKAVTFFGGSKLNGNNKSSLPSSIPAPPVPTPSKCDTPTLSHMIDQFRSPDIVGGNVKLTKSSIFSGSKKDARVQFIDNVDTFEYPSFEVAMAEHGSTGSDEDHHLTNGDDDEDDDDEDDDQPSSSSSLNGDDNIQLKSIVHDPYLSVSSNQDDVDDDELERLARINAKYNSTSPNEKPLKPKGTLHTFRPTHLDQYELGSQHGSISTKRSSDTLSNTSSILPATITSTTTTNHNSYSQLAREKLLSSSESNSMKLFSQHSFVKQQRANFDLGSSIQWSSMSTTTDLLF